MQEYEQLPNKSVRIYPNRLKVHLRRVSWSLITQELVLYNLVSAELRHALKTQVRHWISSGKNRFNRLDQRFDCATGSEYKPDDKEPGGHQQQQGQAGVKKRNF